MATEIDSGGTALADFKRPMLIRTMISRFGHHWSNPLTEAFVKELVANKTVEPAIPCPECRTPCRFELGRLPDGNEVIYPQCSTEPDRADHGYSHLSKHRVRAPQGRVAGKTYAKKAKPQSTPAEAPKPVPPANLNTPIELKKVVHERFADVVRLYRSGVREFMLKGPAGSGKTTIAQDLAEELGCKFVVVQGSSGTEEADLTYWRNPHDGTVKIAPGIQAAIDGPCVYLIDEGDSIMPGVLLSLNMPLANRKIAVNGEVKTFHPDAVFILSGNAVNGQSRQYTGRYPIDAATRDRFYEIFCDYSAAIDEAICPDSEIRRVVNDVRRKVNNDPNLSKVLLPGARFLKRVYLTSIAYNASANQALKQTLSMSYETQVVEQLC